MSNLKITEDQMRDHDAIVDQMHQEYADSITPEYIAEQHALQREPLSNGMATNLPDEYNSIPGDKLPDLDVTVTLMDADGSLYQGCLIGGSEANEGIYWCEWISGNGLEERVGNDAPVGWKANK